MVKELREAYQEKILPSLQLGGIILNDQLVADAPVCLVLKSFNRHGLIAGATGSGKTKTIQVLSEQLSLAGVPSMVMDIKGDLSGLAAAGNTSPELLKRAEMLQVPFTPRAFSVEALSLSDSSPGIPMRASVEDFGPILFSRMLDLNDSQAGVVTILFAYAKEKKLPLIDLGDFKALLQFLTSDSGKQELGSEFGSISSASSSIILRKIIELEAQGAQSFFGEPSFEVRDLLGHNAHGEGVISILRLLDMQQYPKLFSTFMLKLLSDIYNSFPELGDPDKPVLVLFIDEAHLIFNEASKALLNMLNTIVKLIRSKGVSLIFCTQTANDIPEAILSQLGLKIQHALRAFTAKDRQSMKLVARNFPLSALYNTEERLTSLSIGEALVCALDEKGQPTPLIECMVRPPCSRMGVLSAQELQALVSQSSLAARYQQRQSIQGAQEILAAKSLPQKEVHQNSNKKVNEKLEPSMIDTLSKNTLFRQIIRQIFRELTNAVLKLIKGGTKR